jgi:hypothetical protein
MYSVRRRVQIFVLTQSTSSIITTGAPAHSQSIPLLSTAWHRYSAVQLSPSRIHAVTRSVCCCCYWPATVSCLLLPAACCCWSACLPRFRHTLLADAYRGKPAAVLARSSTLRVAVAAELLNLVQLYSCTRMMRALLDLVLVHELGEECTRTYGVAPTIIASADP